MIGIALFPLILILGAVFTVVMLLLTGKGRGRAMGTVAGVTGLVILGVFILYFFLAASHVSSQAVVSQSSPGVVVRQVAPVLSPLVFILGFLFIVFVALLAGKGSGKAGIGVLIGVVLFLLGFFVLVPVATHRRVEERVAEAPTATAVVEPRQWTGPPAASPIWSEGVADEFDADIYPSKLAAVRALGKRMAGPIRQVAQDPNGPSRIVLFRQDDEHELVTALAQALTKTLPAAPSSVEAGRRNITSGEVGVELHLVITGMPPAPWAQPPGSEMAGSGRIEVTAFAGGRQVTINESFIEKPWVEDFASFANARPDRQVIVARSNRTCTDENEARRQAMQDACNQLSRIAGQRWTPVPGRPPLTVSSEDLWDGNFILDQFVQSFDGSAGRIWRSTMLIDASADNLGWLNDRKNAEMQVERVTWARMIASALGVLVVILVTYFFLNMATKGYYIWSLRIAALVLAIVGVVFIFLLS